jgi:hypothetical protein
LLWLRPEVEGLINSGKLEVEQRDRVKAALRRFVTGGLYTVVKAESRHPPSVSRLGDLRELKPPNPLVPPFVELRFKPPKPDLRFFGRFIQNDGLILTSSGMKSPDGKTGEKRLSIPDERYRCDQFFRAQRLELTWVPNKIEQSLSNATFV